MDLTPYYLLGAAIGIGLGPVFAYVIIRVFHLE